MNNNISYILKTILITFALVISFKSNAQEIRVIDNKGTINDVRNNNVTTASTAPTDPLENDVWFDNTIPTNVLTKIYDGTAWVEVPTTNTQTVYVGFFILADPSGTSASFTQTVTGIPFQPSQITLVAHANIEELNRNSDNSVGDNNGGLNNSFGTMHGFARDDGGLVPTQQVIYLGGSGNSINDISRYASSSQCIGVRYGNQNGNNLGVVSATLNNFTADGFELSATRTSTATAEELVVLYTAYK